ncbi:Microtubule-associated protein essential for anaphase spindle elongation [Handroanthus impetiginosus]|uniref:Microtubule-associated protein essential for anaphase spindle elongation n=1 Tax=Handroanthus impetiginosus TaxID=429701 RepID=A0A2G9G326_9LAMI|nr:Microtubule-associated protein essential for anaphase spindle elongation [Handroanthus impetiginosus]
MSTGQSNCLSQMETTCGSLLYELQIIWDEVGESDADRDRMLLEIEQECLEVYRRKVDEANRCRAQLRQAIADAEAELAAICTAMGERPVHIRQSDHNPGSLKDEFRAILPQIEEMRKRKFDRKNQFIEVLKEIQNIKNEIYKSDRFASNNPAIDEADLSMRKLEELQMELQALQKEKRERLKLLTDLLNCLFSLCTVLGLDFKKIVSKIHPSLGEPEEQLGTAVQKLRELKIHRMQQLQDLATSLLELWNLMDTPMEEQQIFQKVTCNIAASEEEMTEPDMLSVDYINYVSAEVSRLEELKASKMKELVLKKKAELEDICRKTHLIPYTDNAMEKAIDAIESGAVDPEYVLEQIELRIAGVKEESLNRKEILEKVEKWIAACEEESWLEEYNRDDNRYNAGRGAHLVLKRAEKARALVSKLPAMVDALISKTIAWENEKGIIFSFDGVRLLCMLEGYKVLRQEKELERKKQRDQKKLQGQLVAEQEALYGSKPSPMKNQNMKKGPRLSSSCASNRRLSLGAPMLQTPKHDRPLSARATPNTRNAKKNERISRHHLKDDGFTPLSSVAILFFMFIHMFRNTTRNFSKGARHRSPNLVNTRELESPMNRKPFSPISLSKSNAANILELPNKNHNETLHKTLIINNTPFTPPTKIISSAEEENRTPPTTAVTLYSMPSTVSVPMQTAITPAPVPKAVTQSPIQMGLSAIKSVDEEIEYSFEERRAGFVLPRSHLMVQV